jgi:putative flavoprotein involved in K+ transport
VTDYPGLFFMGLPWLNKHKSGLLLGVGEDADFIASTIAARAISTSSMLIHQE